MATHELKLEDPIAQQMARLQDEVQNLQMQLVA